MFTGEPERSATLWARWRLELAAGLTADLAGVHSTLEHRYVRDVERPQRLPRSSRQVRPCLFRRMRGLLAVMRCRSRPQAFIGMPAALGSGRLSS